MLALLDTVIGFLVILLLVSFLIKSLTSVVKNHVQYYSQNLRVELKRLLQPLAGVSLQQLERSFPGIDWRNVGEEIFDAATLGRILKRINPHLKLTDLKARLAVHKSALRFSWDKRMKSLSLVCGTALCLLLNINAFTIWKTLYEDTDVRAKFTSDEYVGEVLKQADKIAAEQEEAVAAEPQGDAPTATPVTEEPEEAPPPVTEELEPSSPADGDESTAVADTNQAKRQELADHRQEWQAELERFRQEVDFGIGEIWTMKDAGWGNVLYAIIGSLLTGVLASVGAPYLHDLLRALASFRKKPADVT